MLGCVCWRGTHKSCTFQEIETELDNNVVFISEDLRYLTCDPSVRPTSAQAGMQAGQSHSLFHYLYVDLLHVHLLIELRWKFGLLQQLCIYGGCHSGTLLTLFVARNGSTQLLETES